MIPVYLARRELERKEVKNNYQEYLNSDDWKWKSNQRRLMDGKCRLCGKPFDLNVHHLTYKNVPHESMNDLITLCSHCHQRVESKKKYPGYDSFNIYTYLVVEQFCHEMKDRDKSSGGDCDFCVLPTIKKFLFPYEDEHGVLPENISGSNRVQGYFRNKRYGIILDYHSKGYPEYIVYNQTLFSRAMIHKVYEDTETAKRLMNEPIF